MYLGDVLQGSGPCETCEIKDPVTVSACGTKDGIRSDRDGALKEL